MQIIFTYVFIVGLCTEYRRLGALWPISLLCCTQSATIVSSCRAWTAYYSLSALSALVPRFIVN